MGKRKRQDRDTRPMYNRDEGDKAQGPPNQQESSAAKLLDQRNGSSKVDPGTVYTNASHGDGDKSKRHESVVEMPVEQQHRRKKHKKRKSHHEHEEANASVTQAPHRTDPDQEVAPAAQLLDKSLLPDSQLPSGLSRHQRRRWRRKLIRQDLIPKARYPEMATPMQQMQSVPPNQPGEETSWSDKPIGRKALARQLATTSLMKPPIRRWHDEASRSEAASTSQIEYSTPWQRSAVENRRVVLPGSSVASGTDTKSVVPTKAVASAVPEIRTSTRQDRRLSRSRESLLSALPFSLKAAAKAKRPSLSSKANSVPTFSADGDIAGRFKRFSAAAHGKAMGDSSEESGGTTTESDVGEAASDFQKTSPARDDMYRGNVHAASRVSTSSEHGDLTTFSELMSRAIKPGTTELGIHRNVFGSGVGRERSSIPLQDESQEIVQRATKDIVPLAMIDDETFDADQAIDEILRDEMKLTRELPPGKKVSNVDVGCDDGVLTQDSSDRRITRSASKNKPAILVKRTDSAIPEPGNEVFIVQSMQLPEDGELLQWNGGRFDGADDHFSDDDLDRNRIMATGHHSSSSPLSELNQSPSPPQKRSEPTATADEDVGLQENFDSEEEDTIVVAVAEQAVEPKKKRKMTGRTSKHFSTPKAKEKRTNAHAATEQQDVSASTDGAMRTPVIASSQKRRRSTPTKELLSETRGLIGEDVHVVEHSSPQRPQKRQRRSSGTIANLSDANIIENRSRRADRTAHDGGQTNAKSQQEQTAAIQDEVLPGEEGSRENDHKSPPKPKPRKRSRRNSEPLADLDNSNVIKSRSWQSTAKRHIEDDVGSDGAAQDGQAPAVTNATGMADDPEVESRPKKRPRRSGGKITDLDTGNILEGRSRRRSVPDETAPVEANDANDADEKPSEPPAEQPPPNPRPKRKSTGKRSIYFLPTKPNLDPTIIDRVDFFNSIGKKPRVPAGVSTAPVPSIHSARFGIIQEKLWREPFWLLIAVTFLNKTAGRAAAPVFWKLKESYPTPEALAGADQGELCDMIWHLGLQTQRSRRLIKMAKAWVEAEPVKGVRWRVLHYPAKGNGKELKNDVPVEEDADEVAGAIEIGRIPGTGAYAMDSWRIFCRDILRGVADDYNGKNAASEDFVPEWQKVLPGDKELRACLRWMWLREGWIWDHETGDKRPATEEEMERAVLGEMEVADQQERKFAAMAAGAEGPVKETSTPARDGAPVEGEGEMESEISRPPPSEAKGKLKAPKGRRKRRASTPEADVDDSDDNIVVSSPAKKIRTSSRIATSPAVED